MRTALVPVFAAAVAACSGLPPEPLVPLGYGEVALGVTADMPVHGAPPGVVSLWAALGAGRGVDLAFGVDAPFTLVQWLTDLGRGRGAFVPPGIAVRKSFANGLGVGLGTGSFVDSIEPVGPSPGLVQVAAGLFVTAGTPAAEMVARRATAHVVYEVRGARSDSAQAERGWAVYGVGSAGLVVRADTVFTVYGARGVVGMTLTAPRTPTLTLGGTLQGIALADS